MKNFEQFRKEEEMDESARVNAPLDTSDIALHSLLERYKAADDPNLKQQLSIQIERVIFHKQFKNG